MQVSERQRLHERARRRVIRGSLSREAGDDVGAETEHGEPRGQPLEPRAVRPGRVPVSSHALEHAIGSRLQRGVDMRGQVPRRFDQQPRHLVVDLRRFDGREPEPHGGDGGDERVEQLPQRSPRSGIRYPVLAVGPDMHAGEDQLRVPATQRVCFRDQLRDRPRPVRAPRQRRRAEGAVFVATVLDLEPAATVAREPAQHWIDRAGRQSGRREHGPCRGARHHRAHPRQGRDRTAVQRRRAPHHDGFDTGAPVRDAADQTAQLGFAFCGDGTGIDDGEVGGFRRGDGGRAAVFEGLADQLGVVLVRLAAEGVEVNVHGRTVNPSRIVHTCSVRPPPLRCRYSTP